MATLLPLKLQQVTRTQSLTMSKVMEYNFHGPSLRVQEYLQLSFDMQSHTWLEWGSTEISSFNERQEVSLLSSCPGINFDRTIKLVKFWHSQPHQ